MSPSPQPELLGAILAEGIARFRVWAPNARRVDVLFQDGDRSCFALGRGAEHLLDLDVTRSSSCRWPNVRGGGTEGYDGVQLDPRISSRWLPAGRAAIHLRRERSASPSRTHPTNSGDRTATADHVRGRERAPMQRAVTAGVRERLRDRRYVERCVPSQRARRLRACWQRRAKYQTAFRTRQPESCLVTRRGHLVANLASN